MQACSSRQGALAADWPGAAHNAAAQDTASLTWPSRGQSEKHSDEAAHSFQKQTKAHPVSLGQAQVLLNFYEAAHHLNAIAPVAPTGLHNPHNACRSCHM